MIHVDSWFCVTLQFGTRLAAIILFDPHDPFEVGQAGLMVTVFQVEKERHREVRNVFWCHTARRQEDAGWDSLRLTTWLPRASSGRHP